jgi:hypothetical protein
MGIGAGNSVRAKLEIAVGNQKELEMKFISSLL